MFDNDASSLPSHNDEHRSPDEYLRSADRACAAGDAVLGMHLYLAAFESAQLPDGSLADPAALEGLKEAWKLACSLKERSIAEYVFERLEPYLTADEASTCAQELQVLALDKLEEFGLSREDLEDMTAMISQDIGGLGTARLLHVEHITTPGLLRGDPHAEDGGAEDAEGVEGARAESGAERRSDAAFDGRAVIAVAATADEAPASASGMSVASGDGAPASPVAPAADASDAAGAAGSSADEAAGRPDARGARADAPSDGRAGAPSPARVKPPMPFPLAGAMSASGRNGAEAPAVLSAIEHLTYKELVGYDQTVSLMRDFGVGMQNDAQFQALVRQLNVRHGVDRMPASDAMLFRSPAREDAGRFMTATLGELDLPAIRMRMDENLQGMPVLCVMAQADRQPKMNAARNAFEGPGVLLLEDLDLWAAPLSDQQAPEDLGGFIMASLSRGAREAVALIRSAVENPEVYVLASAAEGGEIDPFFYDLMEPLSIIDIDYPTESERADIWMEIAREHPSLRGVDRSALVRYSAQMPRYDMYMAAREAVEEAYKASLVARHYVPVTSDNLFDKLAAYQPLDSEEYRALEDAVVRDFRVELERLERDLLKGEGE